jgi:hypothetical protein
MVGGKVIETVLQAGRVWVNVCDRVHPKDTCAIYVERNANSEAIQMGDSLWWQGGVAYWTPQEYTAVGCQHREHTDCTGHVGTDYDIQIPRLSYSGVGRPEGHDVFDHDLIQV